LGAYTLVRLVRLVFGAYYVILFVRVVLSFVRLPSYHPVQRTVGRSCEAATEPLLSPIRTALRRYQAGSQWDFSPLVLYLLMVLAEGVIVRALLGW
jgi:uncharacterized protein YggT (Ycf19 family)